MSRAFSLAEAILTMALISLILAVVANLFQLSARSAAQSNQRTATSESAYGAFLQLRCDLESAITLGDPAAGTSSSSISLTRMSPYNTTLTLPPPTPPTTWILHNPAAQLNVTYQMQGTRLVRRVVSPTQTWDVTVADDLHGFQCTSELDSLGQPTFVRIEATIVATTGVVHPLALEVPLHLPPQVSTAP